jgi:hypothetical protein
MRRSSRIGTYMSLVSVIRRNYVLRPNASIRQTDERYRLMRLGGMFVVVAEDVTAAGLGPQWCPAVWDCISGRPVRS